MTAHEMASKLFKTIEAHDLASAAEYISDDFMFSGPVPEPINGGAWLEMLRTLTTAFPDWRYNAEDFREEGGKVRGTVQITGTHKGELDLSSMGMPKVPATGKSIKLPREEVTLGIAESKFTSLKTAGTASGGVMGILTQLGVKVPSAN